MHDFQFWPTLWTIVIVFFVIQGTAGFLVYVERKVCAYMQMRIGPNRVGPVGLFQSVADLGKFLLKEETLPAYADKILFIFAVSSLTVYGIILGGWSSNNKYSMLGGMRSSAQIISYEIPLGLSILGVVLMTGSLNLERIIWRQAEGGFLSWNIFFQPLAFLLFLTSAFAECNRLPFDLPESEQELVGGYHTEYNAFKLAMFLLGEYVHMVTTSFLMVILFFGGWHFPLIATTDSHWLLKLIVIAGKVTFFILLYMLVRWTLPRFRFDQLMGLAWKVLIPLALAKLVAVMFVLEYRLTPWVLLPVSIGILIAAAGFGVWAATGTSGAAVQKLRT